MKKTLTYFFQLVERSRCRVKSSGEQNREINVLRGEQNEVWSTIQEYARYE